MPYKVKVYVEVEPEDPEIYDTLEVSEDVKDHLQSMQPENIYKVEKV